MRCFVEFYSGLCLVTSQVYLTAFDTFIHKLNITSGLVSCWRQSMLQNFFTYPIIGLSLVLKSGDKAVKVLPRKQFILRKPAGHRLIIPFSDETWDALTFNSEWHFNLFVTFCHILSLKCYLIYIKRYASRKSNKAMSALSAEWQGLKQWLTELSDCELVKTLAGLEIKNIL